MNRCPTCLRKLQHEDSFTTRVRLWCATQPNEFTIRDARKAFPCASHSALCTALRVAERFGATVCVQRGSGKRPSTYTRKKASS